MKKLNYYLNERYSSIPLLERIDEISLKIAEQEFRNNKSKARQIRKWLRERLNISIDMKEIYKNFFRSKEFIDIYGHELPESYINRLDEKDISYEDACLFVYMKSLLMFLGNDYLIEQTIVDEAQDYSMLQFLVLQGLTGCRSYTVVGDVNQRLVKIDEVPAMLRLEELYGKFVKRFDLNKSYRSTQQIMEYASKLLDETK